MRQPFAVKFEFERRSTHTWLKILVFEIKRCSKMHFTVAQSQLVLNFFLTFDNLFTAGNMHSTVSLIADYIGKVR